MSILNLRNNIASLAMSALIIFSSNVSLAGKDGVSGGGVITKSGELLDFAEAQTGAGLVPFEPSSFKVLNETLNMIVNRVLDGDVSFGRRLTETIYGTRKTWYFKATPLTNELPTKNLHILLDDKTHQVIAKQDQLKIVIYKPWFESKVNGDQMDLLRAAGLIVHEAVMDTVLEFGMDHDLVRDMVRVIFADELGGKFPKANFVRILKVNGFFPSIYENKTLQVSRMMEEVNKVEALIHSVGTSYSGKAWSDQKTFLLDVREVNYKEFDPVVFYKFSALLNVMTRFQHEKNMETAKAEIEAIKKHLESYLSSFR
jgi:hypothetical protein